MIFDDFGRQALGSVDRWICRYLAWFVMILNDFRRHARRGKPNLVENMRRARKLVLYCLAIGSLGRWIVGSVGIQSDF